MAGWDSNSTSWELEEAPKFESRHRNGISKKDQVRETMPYRSYTNHGIYSHGSNDLDLGRSSTIIPSTIECSTTHWPRYKGIQSKPNVFIDAIDPENDMVNIVQGKVHIVNGCFTNGGVIMPCRSIEKEGFIEGNHRGFDLRNGVFHNGTQSRVSNECGKFNFLEPNKGIENVSFGDMLTEEQYSTNNTLHSGSSGDSLTGLHLGKRVYSQCSPKTRETKKVQEMDTIESKKLRTGAKTAKCQVQGCGIDLTSAKAYHRKHKVCDAHSKAVKVIVAGLEQRFCQQCSRFHQLPEFDNAKRSCRRRLAGHNERRRKPQPDPLAMQSRLQASLQEWSFLHQPKFSTTTTSLPQVYRDFTWPECIVPQCEGRPVYDYKSQVPTKGFNLLPCDNYLPLHQQSPRATGFSPLTYDNFPQCQQNPRTMLMNNDILASYSRTPSSLPLATHGEIFSGFETVPVTGSVDQVRDYGCALSLLSPHWSSSQASHSEPMDPSGQSNITKVDNHHMYETSAPQC